MINVGLTRSVDAGEQKNFTDVMSAWSTYAAYRVFYSLRSTLIVWNHYLHNFGLKIQSP
jgi:cAMP phosphodiesterase